MKRIILFLIIILAISSCKSVRKTTIDINHQKDSTAYTSVTTVDIDTLVIPQDTATLEALIDITPEGNITVEQVDIDQGNDITLDYTVEKTPAGAKVKVKATSKPKEIITQNTTTEIIKTDVSSDVKQTVNEKKVKGYSPWNLAWIIPLALVVLVIYLKRNTILKYFGF